MPLRLGWFSTGRDRAAIDLFNVVREAIAEGTIDAAMAFVFMNRAPGEAPESDEFIRIVEKAGVPLITVSSAAFEPDKRARGMTDPAVMEEWRLSFDREVIDALAGHQADLIVLAGYMLIAGREMCEKFTMINLHPALPGGPKGTWQEVIREIMRNGEKETGAMMHLVTPELDRGPAISYFKFPVRGGFDDIRKDGAERELPLILMTIRSFADGRLKVENGRVYGDGREITGGYDLTDEVDAWLAESAGTRGTN